MDLDKLKNRLVAFSAAALALLPPAAVAWRVFNQAAYNPSNDEVMILPLLAKILGGSYPWFHFFGDTFLNGHSEVFPTLLHLAAAKWFHWDLRLLLAIGLFLFGLKLLVIFKALAPSAPGRWAWLLLPLLSALVFSSSQLSAMEFEFVGIQMGLTYLGVALAIWASTRPGLAWDIAALLGAWIASWSFGGGLMVWPVLFLGWALSGRKRLKDYSMALWVFAVTALPYAVFMIRPENPDLYAWVEGRTGGASLGLSSFFNLSFIFQSLGLPMVSAFNLSLAWWRGLIGIALAVIGILFALRSKCRSPGLIAALLFLLYGFLAIWQISIFRKEVAIWYSCPAMFFWIGLVGMAVALRNVWAWLSFGAVTIFFLQSNLSFEGDSFYSTAKSPAAESCLRHYETAPTYCASTPFLWPPGQYPMFVRLAESLKSGGLSLFAETQRWSLQGDFILGKVKVNQNPKVPRFLWSADLNAKPVRFNDSRALNLFLHSPNSVEWSLTLPADLKRAELHSAVAISPAAPEDPQADGMLFQVWIAEEGSKPRVYFSRLLGPREKAWQPFKISLQSFRGKNIRIGFGSEPLANWGQDWGMYRFPTIQIEKEGSDRSGVVAVKPANTDLASDFPKALPSDFHFQMPLAEYWEVKNLNFAEGSAWRANGRSRFTYRPALNECLADYDKIVVKLGVAEKKYPRAVRVRLHLQGKFPFADEIVLPLLGDGAVHEYSYDLSLLELEPGVRLKGLDLLPVAWQKSRQVQLIQFEGLRLSAGKEKVECP